MTNNKKPKKGSSGNISSSGVISYNLYVSELNEDEEQELLARTLTDLSEDMDRKCIISSDSANFNDVNHWLELISEGLVPYVKKDNGDYICINIWVKGFLQDKEEVKDYVRKQKLVVDAIEQSNEDFSGRLKCPECENRSLDFSVNINNINGTCRSCGFKINIAK